MVVIRLSRVGSKKKPRYRVTVANSKVSSRCKFIEIIGTCNPFLKEKGINIDKKKAEEWIKKGAKPSRRVQSLLKKI